MWSQPPRTDAAIAAVVDLGASFYIANVETTRDLAAFDPAAFRARFPQLECAVATTFGGFEDDPAKAAPYIAAGFTCQTEAYVNTNSNATPNALNVRAHRCGWPGSCTLVGVWGGYPLAAYRDQVAPHPWGVYTAETLTDADWAELKRWTA